MMKAVLASLALAALLLQVDAAKKDVKFKSKFVPVLNPQMSAKDVKAYANDPANKPRPDFTPTGTIPQPSTSGTSKTEKSTGKKTQIIGGKRATLKMFPWQVYIYIDDAWLCGGSIISDQWVLTAAHCVDGGATFEIGAGGIDNINDESFEQIKIATEFVMHESYDDNSLVNDIALIKVPTPFTFNDYVKPIKLPTDYDAKNSTFEKAAAIASGYGMTQNTGDASDYMNYVSLVVIANSLCARTYGTGTVKSTTICTGADLKKSICSGDSGGPLQVLGLDKLYKIIGVVSFGAAVSCTKYPAGYTRVSSYLGWISKYTSILIKAR